MHGRLLGLFSRACLGILLILNGPANALAIGLVSARSTCSCSRETASVQNHWGAQNVFALRIDAKDPRGNAVSAAFALGSQPLGENVLLRLDKAIYQSGERMNIDVRTSAGLPTVYVDIVRGGQIMLSKW